MVATQTFFIFIPKIGEDGTQFDDHIFQDGVGSTTNQSHINDMIPGWRIFVAGKKIPETSLRPWDPFGVPDDFGD